MLKASIFFKFPLKTTSLSVPKFGIAKFNIYVDVDGVYTNDIQEGKIVVISWLNVDTEVTVQGASTLIFAGTWSDLKVKVQLGKVIKS